MKFTQAGRTRGDETTPYSVSDYESTTVGEFINEVLKKRPNEWGYIQVYHKDAGFLFSPQVCEYSDGKIVKSDHPELLDRKIQKIDACGGWTRMDYMVFVEE